MREETEYRPKPLVEIGGRPILWHIMKMFNHYGQDDFILCLGYRGQMIKEYFLQYHAMNNDFSLKLGAANTPVYHEPVEGDAFTVTLAETGLATMTGGRILRASQYVSGDTFMVTYGDGVADVIEQLIAFHRSHGRAATVTVFRPASRFGMMDLDADGTVESFIEKPRIESWASAGFFVFERRVLDYLDGDDCVLEKEPLQRLAKEKQLVAYRHDGCFYAMDTYREYLQLNDLWDRGKAQWKTW